MGIQFLKSSCDIAICSYQLGCWYENKLRSADTMANAARKYEVADCLQLALMTNRGDGGGDHMAGMGYLLSIILFKSIDWSGGHVLA